MKTKKIISFIFVIFSCFSLFVKSNLTQPQKKNINFFVMMRTNHAECLGFNPKHKKVYVSRITYSDYEKGIVDYGDNDYLANATEYNFSDGIISLVQEADLYKIEIAERPWLELSVIRNEFADCESFAERKLHNIVAEFKSDGITYMKYQNGILMEEYSDGVLYRYMTVNGKGEYQKKENGKFVTVATLEHNTDKDGYLIYQKLSFMTGDVSEIIIGEMLPDVSRLINRYYH